MTHPEVTRYFMTIPEATQLVLQAGSMGRGGEIFLLDMGEAVRIVHLAEELIRLSGFRPYEDIDIVFTGLRPGEKLYEELLLAGEGIVPTTHEKIMVAKATACDAQMLNGQLEELFQAAVITSYSIHYTKLYDALSTCHDYNSHNTKRLSLDEIKEKLMALDFIKQELTGGKGCEF